MCYLLNHIVSGCINDKRTIHICIIATTNNIDSDDCCYSYIVGALFYSIPQLRFVMAFLTRHLTIKYTKCFFFFIFRINQYLFVWEPFNTKICIDKYTYWEHCTSMSEHLLFMIIDILCIWLRALRGVTVYNYKQ